MSCERNRYGKQSDISYLSPPFPCPSLSTYINEKTERKEEIIAKTDVGVAEKFSLLKCVSLDNNFLNAKYEKLQYSTCTFKINMPPEKNIKLKCTSHWLITRTFVLSRCNGKKSEIVNNINNKKKNENVKNFRVPNPKHSRQFMLILIKHKTSNCE